MATAPMYLLGQSPRQRELIAWMSEHPEIMPGIPAYERLQLERWLWDNRARMCGAIVDVGVINRRDWLLGAGQLGTYRTLGLTEDEDIVGDLESIPLGTNSVHVMICTNVLEHVKRPWLAVQEMHRVLKPGGVMFAAAPWIWPHHPTDKYRDYWRISADAWAEMLSGWAGYKITSPEWTEEGKELIEMVGEWEYFGLETMPPDSLKYEYYVEAVK